jgi:hypothetical protein
MLDFPSLVFAVIAIVMATTSALVAYAHRVDTSAMDREMVAREAFVARYEVSAQEADLLLQVRAGGPASDHVHDADVAPRRRLPATRRAHPLGVRRPDVRHVLRAVQRATDHLRPVLRQLRLEGHGTA